MSAMTELFGEPISIYTREQATQDGVLIDLSEWAGSGPHGMLGGFACPVAVTASVWSDLNRFPKGSGQDLRGRAHDLLWMARCAAKSARNGQSELLFQVYLTVGRSRRQTYKLVAGPGDRGELVMTIMQTDED